MNFQSEVLKMVDREIERRAMMRPKIPLSWKLTGPLLQTAYPPAVDRDLRDFETQYRFSLPDDLCAWLKCHNGACIGRGCCFAVNAVDPRLSIDWIYANNPDWLRLRWFPVGNDSCGNFYVQVIKDAPPHPVVFIDTIHDPNEICYCVASGVWPFLWFSLTESEFVASRPESQPTRPQFWWPFDQKRVIAVDPAIESFSELPMPWSKTGG